MLPDPGEVREILTTLIADWNTGTSVDVGVRENILVGLTIYGLTAHTHALAEAVVTLYDSDQYTAAVPLVRQMIECAMTTVWVELAGYPGALALVHEQSRNVRNALKAFAAAGMPPNEEATRKLEDDLRADLTTTTPAGRNFEQRCREIDGGDVMYATYRSASQVSHATVSIVDLYFEGADLEEAAPYQVALLTRPKENAADLWLGIALSMVIQATSVWSRIDRSHTSRTRMKDLNRRLGTRYRQQFTAHGLRSQHTRESEFRKWRAGQNRGSA